MEVEKSSSSSATPILEKKKRSLPGTPDPDAEVVALSPKTLLATNRFVCEICSKGFQRDQNLQLHRRGHNLPWKLKQRSGAKSDDPPRKRVYVCPETSCVHHNPSRALGDLTGIKKHFCRKHGEKKWKCDRCGKKYAVLSDWKAHSKTCGTREYRCDCGTLFSRKDSFITHRAFCDVLAEENKQILNRMAVPPASSPSPIPLSPGISGQSSDNVIGLAPATPPSSTITDITSMITKSHPSVSVSPSMMYSFTRSPSLSLSSSVYLPVSGPATSFQEQENLCSTRYLSSQKPAMSATALLQKAAEMGASSSPSFLRGLGLQVSSSSSGPQLGDSSLFGSKPTLDFLGLGMNSGPPFLGSLEGGSSDDTTPAGLWNGQPFR